MTARHVLLAIVLSASVLLAGCATPDAPGTPDTNTTPTPTSAPTPTTPTPDGEDPRPEDGTGPLSWPTVPCGDAAPGSPAPQWMSAHPRVTLNTSMGAIVVQLNREAAPVTVQNFLNLTKQGVYDGVLFHRVIADFMIQTGDPLSKDANPANDGTGGPGYAIPDEFSPALRHDKAGVVSMANSGPNSGGSQFFITLKATPHLDDRHAVFGSVVEGMDIVEEISATAIGANDRPVEDVTLETVEVMEDVPFTTRPSVGVHPVIPSKTAVEGRATTFAVILANDGSVRDRVALTADVPAGWTCEVTEPPTISAGTGRVVFLTLTPAAGATGTHSIPLTATSAWASTTPATAKVDVVIGTLGADVKQGDSVTANYAGLLPDGRLFDTSMEAVGSNPDQPKFATPGGYRERSTFNTFSFTVGSGVIAGFTNLAKTAKVGETVTALIPAKDAYATGNQYDRPLTGRDLVFELEIVEKA